jgi:hypothetical protein
MCPQFAEPYTWGRNPTITKSRTLQSTTTTNTSLYPQLTIHQSESPSITNIEPTNLINQTRADITTALAGDINLFTATVDADPTGTT